MPLCCLATSTREATPKPPDWDTATVTGVPPQPYLLLTKVFSGRSTLRATPGQVLDPHKGRPPKTSSLTTKGNCQITGRCPSKQNAADTTPRTSSRGSALNPRQESLSPITSGTPRGFAPPGPSSATPDSNSLPVPLESPEQCQALSISDVAPPLTLISVPGPKLVPVPDPNHVTEPLNEILQPHRIDHCKL
ncbi:WAS/WASL-interacting protein family member 2-like [Macrobrachium rosenbergii]|uniref:WAS/WASL-interacting protein family member 2-like n=1 Tax=Macrobrachium rosenbergii TaxID=79674 RepID=UPI0034D5890F